MAKLSDDEVRDALAGLPGWAQPGQEIEKEYQFEDFAAAMRFVNGVAEAAEAAEHHPDIDIRWNRVRLALRTHSQDAITDKDVSLAREIEGLAGP